MAKTMKQQKAAFNELTRPHPFHIYFFPLFFGIVSIMAPHESRPHTIAVGIMMILLLVFALYVTFFNRHDRRLYNRYLSITMVITSIITLIPGLKISVGVFWIVFLLFFWCIVYLVSFYGEKVFPSKKFPVWGIIACTVFFLLMSWITSNGAVGYGGTLYVSMLEDEHMLVSLFGEEKGWQFVSYLYSLSSSSLLLMFSKTILHVRNKEGV
ncbi:hypothetical protein [Sediminibacillus massiliensis]|uniref:hypothetical protein n=1 Tax=Sediminibacillus massiliensis TaxID=1926277 RepID=UPI0009883CF3|nr:hypothetical protein [Sediminibacillus massiliensis]